MGKVLFMRKGDTHTAPKVGLPNGYTKLAYIQSSGTQYVNTEYIPNQNTRVVAEMEYVSHSNATCSLFGSGIASHGEAFETFYLSGMYYFGFGSANYTATANVTTGKKMLIDLAKDRAVYDIGGTVLNLTPTASQTFTGQYELLIHAMHRGGSKQYLSVSRTYSFKIYDNGTPVRDFVPCINDSGTVGLYDLVGKKFYGNAGTGTFGAGDVVEYSLPTGYTELEYIQSTGTQYIDTQVFAVSGYTATVDFQATYVPASGQSFILAEYDQSGSWRSGLYDGSFYTSGGFTYSQTSSTTARTIATGKCTATIPYPMYLFAQSENGKPAHLANSKYKLFSCRILDNNGNLVRVFAPCIGASGSVGLYDVITKKFYGNAGTGEFIGSEVAA